MPYKYENIRSQIRTGDIILSSGSSAFSKVIKEFTGCQWSHAALAVKGEDVGLESGRLYVWEATGRGVGEVDFEKACYTPNVDFLSRLTNHGAGDLAWRQLDTVRTADILLKLKAHMDEHRGKRYEEDKVQMICAVPWIAAIPGLANHKQDLSTLFCWECVAAAYQAMGLLNDDYPACSYSNVDFASTLPLVNASLSPLYRFTIP